MGISDQDIGDGFFAPPGGGGSRIYGPDGRYLAGQELAADEEGLVVLDIDLSDTDGAKTLVDGVGHYSRPDLLS